MERYNYEEAVKEDLRAYIKERMEWEEIKTAEQLEEAREGIYDKAFVSDSVTGNGSGSYFFSAWKAEEALCHNLELLGEACAEFCDNAGEVLMNGAEAADVTVRCYLLGQVFGEVFDEIRDELDGEEDGEEVEK